ncbi:dienelactone hydrolase family protein [Legionella rubrilucens]|uniref:Dienelactone hydrolase family protein n=1 Tax=Legionella rubrilucens TaxID=458 RepID=A0A0W0XLY8_9GAMM|nr:dienelactone hydrolase family protein [Legionella rubrilucens]KTD45563.1 dienelactone hydrolase family protein [Legionella rubrilucens]
MIQCNDVDYQHGETLCQGYFAYDDRTTEIRPVVMIAPDWRGRGAAPCEKARQLASMGYVGFALDMYGEARLGLDNEQRRALMTPLVQNRAHLAQRILAAYTTVCNLPQADVSRIAAIGYCFGGLCVLDLARTGVELRGVVSFHGLLSEPPGSNAAITAKVLVLHGYDDPLVPPEQVRQFADEMTRKGVDWQVHMYGLTAHSFSNPDAHEKESGLMYNASADQRSWQTTALFLEEIFKD